MTSQDWLSLLRRRRRRPPPQVTPATGHELESRIEEEVDAQPAAPPMRRIPTRTPPTVARKAVRVPRRPSATDDPEFDDLWNRYHGIVEVR
jgi:hypothetical protein